MPVRHVQIYAIPAPQIAKANLEWNNVKNYVWLVLKPVVNAQILAEVWLLILQIQQKNVLKLAVYVPKPAVHVPKNVKSIQTLSLVKNVQKHAESAKKNVKSVRQNAKLLPPKEFLNQQAIV